MVKEIVENPLLARLIFAKLIENLRISDDRFGKSLGSNTITYDNWSWID